MQKRFIQFSVLIMVVLVVRACLRSSFPEYIPDGRKYGGAEWQKNYNSIEPARFGLRRVRQGVFYGYVNESGKEVIKPEYLYLGCFRNNYTDIYAQKDGNWGTVSYKGDYNQLFKTVKTFPDFWKEQFYSVGYHSYGMAVARSRHNMKYGFVDKKGMERVYCDYDAVGHFTVDGLAWVEKQDPRSNTKMYGYVNADGVEVVPCQYSNVGFFSEGLAWVSVYNDALKSDLNGFVDKNGKIVIPADYQSANDFKNGLAWVKKQDKVGFIDRNNKVVIPLEYDNAGYFFNDMVWLRKGDKYTVANKYGRRIGDYEHEGRRVTNPDVYYDEIGNFFSDFTRAKKGTTVSLINKKGLSIYDADDIDAISEGKAAFKKGNKWGYIKTNGAILVEPSYDIVFPFYDGYAIVSNNKKYGLIDSTGKPVVPTEYDAIGLWCRNYLRVRKGDKWGFIDLPNKRMFPGGLVYQQAWNFRDELVYPQAWNAKEEVALVKRNDRYTYIQPGGYELMPFYEDIGKYSIGHTAYKIDSIWYLMVKGYLQTFKYASSFVNDLAFVDYNKVIRMNGETAFELEFQNHGDFSEGMAAVKINGLWGFVDGMGDVRVPCAYDAVLAFSEGLAGVKTKGKWGFVDNKGKLVVPTIFDDVNSFYKGTAQVKLGNYRYELEEKSFR